MATFSTYAEILRSDHEQLKAYKAGITKSPPGILLQDVLATTGGAYVFDVDVSGSMRERIRQVAELTSDDRLRAVAERSTIPTSLEHLRYADPATTRIVLGCRFEVTPEESERLGWRHEGPYDPKTTIRIDNT